MLHSASTSIISQFRKNSNHDHDDDDSSEVCSRFLLQGPSQCGKTSLLMDVAYDVIHRNTKRRKRRNRDNMLILEEQDEVEAEVVEPLVTFLTPSKNRSNLYFPLICSSTIRHDPNDVDTDSTVGSVGFNANNNNNTMSELEIQEQQFHQQMSALEHQQRKLNHHHDNHDSFPSTKQPTFRNSNWNIQDHASILSKIQIRYIDSIHDLIKYLASIHFNRFKGGGGSGSGCGGSNQQVSCMIIDDLDYYIQDCDMSSNDGNTMEPQMNVNDDEEEDEVGRNDNHHSVAKSLFQDLEQVQNENEKKKRLKESGGNHGTSSTVEMMRLVQLLAHIADACNHLHQNEIPSSFYTCINTDNLTIPQSFIPLLQNYVSTIATITPIVANMQYPQDKQQQQQQQRRLNNHHQQSINKLFNIESTSSSLSSSEVTTTTNQISSLWQIHIERNYSKDFLLRTNPNKFNTANTQQPKQWIFQSQVLYAIVWTYNQFHDSEYGNRGLGLDDYSDDEEIDYDAKEILWRLV